MIANKRLLPLAKIAANTDRTRKSLEYVYVKGNTAVATNGSILAMTEFDDVKPEEFPSVPWEYTEDAMLVGHEQITNAIKTLPKKKSYLPCTSHVAIKKDPETGQSMVISSQFSSYVSFSTSQEHLPYPDYPNVWPKPRDRRKRFTVGISLANLEHIVNMLKATEGAQPTVYLRGPIGNVNEGMTFFTSPTGYNNKRVVFKGMVMPMRVDDNMEIYDHLDYLDLKDKPKPEPIVLDEEHWDCECDVRYIHPNGMLWCPFCRTRKQDQPQARANEVKFFRDGGDTSIDLVLPGTDVLPDWMLTDVYEEGVTESKEEAT